jgi:transcriptional/translational regulatory protein YebC/TACO1
MVTTLTDNRARTAPDIRYIFERGGGSIGSPGSVAFQFTLRSQFAIERAGRSDDQLTELALELGADDVEFDGETAVLLAPANDFIAMKAALEKAANVFVSAELAWVPQTRVPVADKDDARKVLKLIELLEDNEDVQNVYANYDIPGEWLDELA